MVDRKPKEAEANGSREAPLDVLIAGAGYVGLTAAVSLKQARPGLAIAVVDAAPAGVWQKDGRGFMLIGALPKAQLELLATTLAARVA